MEEAGWSPQRIRDALDAARRQDASFAAGQILGSMCTEPHPAAAAAHAAFLATNLGDPGHFPGTAALEHELLADVAALVHGPGPEAARYLTGGTEANILACHLARETTGGSTIIVPESAHFSFQKAANLLRMQLVKVPTLHHRADPGAMAEAALAHDDTALMVGVAGTTELGLVDPIVELADAARQAGVPFHVDAAFGGYVLPFLDGAPPFDLHVAGVTSIGLDPHKMGMAPIPGGALVLAEPNQWDRIAVETGYVSTDTQSTLMGTRPGAAVAAAWAVHRALGRDGYREIVATCMANTRVLADGLRGLGAELVAEPELNVVTFRGAGGPAGGQASGKSAGRLAQALAGLGFRLNVVPRFDALRIVVNPHVTRDVVDRFLAAIAAVEVTP